MLGILILRLGRMRFCFQEYFRYGKVHNLEPAVHIYTVEVKYIHFQSMDLSLILKFVINVLFWSL